MVKKSTNKLILFLTLFLALGATLFFLLKAESITGKKVQSSNPFTYEFEYTADYDVNGDVKGLVAKSDYIVTGHYEKFVENWEMGENYHSEVYTFIVDKELFGATGKTIDVAIPHTVMLESNEDGEHVEAELNLPNYNKPDINKEYVLFLKKLQTKEAYGPASVPFQVEIDSKGKVELKTNTENTEVKKVIKSKNVVHFKTETIDMSKVDKISGKNKNDLLKEINMEIKNK
ncbi:hypothetical protein LS684_10690 [Cytobacillus spongiae]|jgi:hypothetical protein|uniref:hypothetical protein n=1 Tax=Cytobacillus spongiae TaxID=2901381 RepID=UPI001F2FD612|nr:hypothetical protein [Cytobacillus spongiae]UII54169.1 hypothetical protein LS684_10690 [Cytobacillus spongiae]